MPSADKPAAILLWPDVLANETQVRQFLSTVSYCRMFMGPKYADTARPLVELTRKGTSFVWGPPHTAAVRRLTKLLAEYTTPQIPDPTQPCTLYTDASGYVLGAVLEQDGKPVGFLTQAERLEKSATQGNSTAEVFNTIDRFAWDQTPAFVKVYVQLDGLTDLPPDATSAHFEENSAEFVVRNLRQKNYTLKFNPLYAPIDTQSMSQTSPLNATLPQSAWLRYTAALQGLSLVGPPLDWARLVAVPIDPAGGQRFLCNSFCGCIHLVRLMQQRPGEHWDTIAKATQPNAIPKIDPSADPSQSIMDMMKNLYNQGDSEMKRTIAKAWTESQERKMNGISADDGVF
ncbi:calcyclin binding protein, putative [Eimeria brunetti]|uniref:Calcyclin binding protein, putative n=1 Tax=Eimeria brunetti TaxID=51314 RepID=U6L6D2_9EIME|nr:calcyclin binding protein, putative [Eimeria brunetti]